MTDIIITEEALRTRVRELGAQISSDYAGRELDVVCLINGANMFCPDLVRHITVPMRQHFLGFTAYKSAGTTGEVRVTHDVAEPLEGRHVLVVEGIVITGRTPRYLMELMKLRKPASVALCALGRKPQAKAADLTIDYVAFELGNDFAAGYGIGAGPERNLPHLVRLAQPGAAH
jgi:hypoxanthine phosphoribosyltransferase